MAAGHGDRRALPRAPDGAPVIVGIVIVVLLAASAFWLVSSGPLSLRAAYERDVNDALPAVSTQPAVTEADLAHLPGPVARYLRLVGVVGQPRVQTFRVSAHGRIRSARDAPWIALSCEQHNIVVGDRARFFYLRGRMFALPVYGYHRYLGASATMRIKAAALVTVVDAAGSEMTQGETVTLFNDMCVMAPATLIDPTIVWLAVDDRSARATFTNAGHTIRAELLFNESGELVDFRSDDRYQATPDGKAFRLVRWSTPISGYRDFGAFRLAGRGEGRWHESGGDYSYIELTIDDVQYNVRGRRPVASG